MRHSSTIIRTLFFGFAILLLEGCAAGRSVVTLEDINQTANPPSGIEIALETPKDNRTFEVKPKQPRTPSFDPSDLEAQKIKNRLVGRKRGAYGQALGSVLLPENETISSWFKKITTEGFQLAGYRVLEPNDKGYDTAPKVDISINKFWSWFNPGFWSVTASNEAEIELSGNIQALKGGLIVSNELENAPSTAVTDKDWSDVTNESSKELAKIIANKLK